MKIEKFEDLLAWQEARKLAAIVYRVTKREPFQSDWELVRQVRAAAVSIMANLAEGFSRFSLKENKQFYVIARSSLAELRSHIYVATDQGYLTESDANGLRGHMEIVGKLLTGLIRNSRIRLVKEPLSYSTIQPLDAVKE